MISPREAKARVAHWAAVAVEKPESAAAQFNLALAYSAQGRVRQAEEAYRKALDLDPDLVEAWINLGGLLLLRWEFEKALAANREALSRRPDSLLAHYNAGQAHLYLGHAEEVVTAYRRVLELDADHAGGHYYLAVGLLASGRPAEARAHLDRALALGHKPTADFLKALERAEHEPQSVPALVIDQSREPELPPRR